MSNITKLEPLGVPATLRSNEVNYYVETMWYDASVRGRG